MDREINSKAGESGKTGEEFPASPTPRLPHIPACDECCGRGEPIKQCLMADKPWHPRIRGRFDQKIISVGKESQQAIDRRQEKVRSREDAKYCVDPPQSVASRIQDSLQFSMTRLEWGKLLAADVHSLVWRDEAKANSCLSRRGQNFPTSLMSRIGQPQLNEPVTRDLRG